MNEECVLIPGSEEEYETCFVFYYQGRRYVESGDETDFYDGHGPVIVSKKDGEIFETGSEHTTEHYVNSFIGCGDPLGEPGINIELSGFISGSSKLEAIKLLKIIASKNTLEAKNNIEKIEGGEKLIITTSSIEAATNAVKDLELCGFKCRHMWCEHVEDDLGFGAIGHILDVDFEEAHTAKVIIQAPSLNIENFKIYIDGYIENAKNKDINPDGQIYFLIESGSHRIVIREKEVKVVGRLESDTVHFTISDHEEIKLLFSRKDDTLELIHC